MLSSRTRLAFGLATSLMLLGACSADDVASLLAPVNAASATAQITIWTSDSSPSPIEVSVDGSVVGTLTLYRTAPPPCGVATTGAAITVTLPIGSHIVSARETRDSGYWPPNTVSLAGGDCFTFALTP